MALNATTLADFSGFLNREQSEDIFTKAAQQSVVQSLAQRVPLGFAGQSIPVVTGKPSASWVTEGTKKPVNAGSMTLKNLDPKKIATIIVVSAEVLRANPGGYIDGIKPQIAEAFALAFDAAALHGTNTPFGTSYIDNGSSTKESTGTGIGTFGTGVQFYDDLNDGLRTLITAGKKPNGWAWDSRMEPEFNGAKDAQNRPLFIDAPYSETAGLLREGRLLGRPAFLGDGVYAATPRIYGYLGDWSQVAWGAVGEISYSVSTEASVTLGGTNTLTSLWENNLVGILAEAEYGFLVNDAAAFIKYTALT